MVFLHLLAEERPFPANDKEMVGWGREETGTLKKMP